MPSSMVLCFLAVKQQSLLILRQTFVEEFPIVWIFVGRRFELACIALCIMHCGW